MSYTLWHIDGESLVKRRPRMEIVGKTFMLYDQQWRSEPVFFGDLIYHGKEGEAHVFGLEDGIKGRPKWRLGLKGEIPPELAGLLPETKKPAISNIGMLIIAFLCLGIIWFVAA
ncbi:hypothetical protein MNBD_ALPHA04-528 [hydrothermal vent metagenome]|uniref:Uncharacterized protein n=1 Tax=hydrothermal vent metagenome TaxID=652676 RepID=A0A3B0RPQ2_9ZZZZ